MSEGPPVESIFRGVDLAEPFLVTAGGTLAVGAFLDRVARLRQVLAGDAPVVNLCAGRSGFLVSYVSCLLARRTTLLPVSRAPEAVDALRALYPGAVDLDDAGVAQALELATPYAAGTSLEVPVDQLSMVGCTSGSTGTPSLHRKFWGSVVRSTALNAAAIRAALPSASRDARAWIIGTVPSQHMYGMELTVLLPLLAGMGLHAAQPLLPSGIAEAIAQTPEPRVLVSTPAHLRAVVGSGIRLPPVAVTISATAPLDPALAVEVERVTGGTLLEMFGSTETCIFATRRTAAGTLWTPYPGVRFLPEASGTGVDAPWFPQPERLHDLMELDDQGRFSLVGRATEIVEVAGKRISLSDLTQRLLRIPGVRDGVVFQPSGSQGLVRRLAALVVAPELGVETIRAALAQAFDPVFMPRPLLRVAALPRTAAGKLPQAALEAALREAMGENQAV